MQVCWHLFSRITLLEAGLDEAGRGCYAGPVFAAAVILPQDFHHPLLNDSKQLREKERDLLRPLIEKEAISFAVSQISHEEIDQINILKASIKAMHQAVSLLKKKPGLLLVDGNRFIPYKKIPHQCFVKGDSDLHRLPQPACWPKRIEMNGWEKYIRNFLSMVGIEIKDMVPHNTEQPLKNGVYVPITEKVFDYFQINRNYSS